MSHKKLPQHVAIIPDGNRRWARQQNVPVYEGHARGVDIFRTVVNHAADRGVQCVSVWGLSADNFIRRSPREIAGLMNIFRHHFSRLVHDEDIHRRQICIRVFGRWREKFPASVWQAIEAAQAATRQYTKYACNFLLAYNGTDEMVQAIQSIADNGNGKKLRVTPKLIKQHLFTRDLPAVDLVIRTGGEPHLSAGFMMWDIADAQLHFTDKFWPAFTARDFDKALDEYTARARRFGR
jgi:tritrans,polycis-undecaprenyl-diphosphate synthase [geranylgeranyl-diphosphate specific]